MVKITLKKVVPAIALGGYLAFIGIKTGASQLKSYVGYRTHKRAAELLAREQRGLHCFYPSEPVPLDDLLNLIPQNAGNAADIYREIITSVEDREGEHPGFLSNQELERLMEATALRRCSFPDEYALQMNGRSFTAFERMARELIAIGERCEREEDYELARQFYERTVILGRHLHTNTLDFTQYFLGKQISFEGIRKLTDLTVLTRAGNLPHLIAKLKDNYLEELWLREQLFLLYGDGFDEVARTQLAMRYLRGFRRYPYPYRTSAYGHPKRVLRVEAAKALRSTLAARMNELDSLRSIPLLFRVVLWTDLQGKEHTWWEERDIASALKLAAEFEPEPYIREMLCSPDMGPDDVRSATENEIRKRMLRNYRFRR